MIKEDAMPGILETIRMKLSGTPLTPPKIQAKGILVLPSDREELDRIVLSASDDNARRRRMHANSDGGRRMLADAIARNKYINKPLRTEWIRRR